MTLLTRKEVANALRIHEKNIDRVWPELIGYGAFRLTSNGSWRLAKEDFDRYLHDKRFPAEQ